MASAKYSRGSKAQPQAALERRTLLLILYCVWSRVGRQKQERPDCANESVGVLEDR